MSVVPGFRFSESIEFEDVAPAAAAGVSAAPRLAKAPSLSILRRESVTE
jgi:hypothetical protein